MASDFDPSTVDSEPLLTMTKHPEFHSSVSPLFNKIEAIGKPERTSSPDIVMGAYLISHMRQVCENCGTFSTPQWRKGWFSEVLNRHCQLCNACGLKYHKNQYCPYCRFVYGKEHDKIAEGWLSCQTCGRWVHQSCETKFNGSVVEIDAYYSCPGCRGQPVTHHLPLPNAQTSRL